MNRRNMLLYLALGIIVLAGTGYWVSREQTARRVAEVSLQNKYRLAFYNLVENVQNMEILLSKTLVGQEAEQDARLFMDLWQQALTAQANLGQLPVPNNTVTRTIKFANQTGAYAQILALQSSAGKAKEEGQWQTLQALYRQARQLNTELHGVEADISDGRLKFSELQRESRSALRRAGPVLANSNFQTIDKNMQEFPTLIYDGPFSDHIDRRTPLGLQGKTGSAEQAREKSLSFIGSRPGTTYITNMIKKDSGRIPVYRVEITPRPFKRGERIALGISQQGIEPVWMINSRDIGKARITPDDAGERAARFLEQKGFAGMEKTYFETQGNLVVHNFAATQGGIILYPDQIKVSVASDNGEVVGFDASAYWMSHRERKIPAPLLTEEQAKLKISRRLENVSPGRLAIIPRGADGEVLAYEFRGALDSDVFLVYINARTGKEEDVLRLVRTSKGVLTR